MIKNYFKTAIRSLKRNSNYTVINIAGLGAGIAICIIIFILISYQTSFDNFHSKKDCIYRVLTEYHHADSKEIFFGKGVPKPLPNGIKATFPQVENVATTYADYDDQVLVMNNNNAVSKKFKEEKGVFYTEPAFFSMFNYPLLNGTYESLKEPNNALLTKEIAIKYFGDWQTAIGKSIKLNNNDQLKISGILADVPSNTDFRLKVVVSYGTGFTKRFSQDNDWDGTSSDFGCYIQLAAGASPTNFNNQLRAYAKKVKSPDNKDSHIIQPLSEVHYDTKAGNYSSQTVSHQLINALWLIAAFILLIACVNFINLSTAQAVNRAKEIGVRKVLGSNRWQLKVQFLAETFIIVVASVVVAVIISFIALPYVSKVLEFSLSLNLLSTAKNILLLFIFSIAITLLAGFYPSIVLSRFNPINALKSKAVATNNRSISLRRGLVVFQFVIAQALIIGTLIIVKQMNYFISQPIGFNKDAIVNVPLPTDSASLTKLEYLKKQLSQVNGIKLVSFSSNTPIEDNNDNWTMFNFDHSLKETDFYSIIKMADNNYLTAYELPLVAGRNVEASDTIREFIVNEAVLRNLNIKNPNDALNKEISFSPTTKGPIVGVVKNFNTRSFRSDLAPLIITTSKHRYSQAGIKLATTAVTPAMQSIEKIWNQTFPDYVFEYKFLDDKIAGFYKQENQLGQLYKIFAFIAIMLSCLGLYGLVSFMAVQRIKEVGVRKVLGATAANIVYLFSKELVVLIAVAFVIATPIAWYYMHQWLQDYPFKIELNAWLFVAGGIASIIIALLTVSFQAIKAAVANPVKSLRSE